MNTLLLMLLSMVISTIGDVFSRSSADLPLSQAWPRVLLAGLCWGTMAPAWYFLYKGNDFLKVLCTYTPISIVLYAMVGIFFFGDRFTVQTGVAAFLALACVCVMSLKF